MTIRQARNVNAVCSFFLGPLNEYERAVPEAEAMEALAELAAQANKALQAGWTDSRVKMRFFPCRPLPIRRKGKS
jgi:hypothetical protein